jgi:hypothetical protein
LFNKTIQLLFILRYFININDIQIRANRNHKKIISRVGIEISNKTASTNQEIS